MNELVHREKSCQSGGSLRHRGSHLREGSVVSKATKEAEQEREETFGLANKKIVRELSKDILVECKGWKLDCRG